MKLFTLLALLGAANAGTFVDNIKKNGMGATDPNLAQTKAQYRGYGGYGGYAQVGSKNQMGYGGYAQVGSKAQYGGYGGYGGYAQVGSKNQMGYGGYAQVGSKAQYGGYYGYAQTSSAIDENEAPSCDGCVFETDITTGEFVSAIIDSLDLNNSDGICLREASMLTRRVLKLLGYDKDTIKEHVEIVKEAYNNLAVDEIPKEQLLESMSAMCADLELLTPEDVIYFLYEVSASDEGIVTKTAMKKTLRRLGIRMDKRKLGSLLRQLDTDMDREISPEEIDAWVESCSEDCDDGSCDDGSCDDGSCDDGSCDDGSCDDGSCDDGCCDDGSCDGGEDCDCLEATF